MELVEHSFYYEWEMELIRWLQAHLGTAGTALAAFFTMFGEELAVVAAVGLIYWCLDKKLGRSVGLALLTGMAVNPMIKNIVMRPRPYIADSSVQCLRPVNPGADIYDSSAQGYSFPSGHATDTVTLYSSTAMFTRKKALAALGTVIPLLCGVSRVCLGVHYPTDVLCGWLLGICVMLITAWLDRKIQNKLIYYVLLTAATLPGWFFCRSDDYFTCFGTLTGFLLALGFEKRFVGFENTRRPVRCALRVIGGIVLFLGLNELLKLPFDRQFLASGTLLSHAVRSARYCVNIFIIIGIYPAVFKPADRLLDRTARGKAADDTV